ncbi:MAG: hypothetical protein IJP16_05005 [Clostridia bacterium]|nr:hypothetical protein [Clostridia bacterium]MBQ9975850.1 hypothetical protein [Clostridia bacterium]
MPRYIDAEKLKQDLHQEDFGTPDERWRPESEFAILVDAQPDANNGWIYDRLPTKEEEENGIVGIVNGRNKNINFKNGLIFLSYDFEKNCWDSEDFDITNCRVECWFPVPAHRPNIVRHGG